LLDSLLQEKMAEFRMIRRMAFSATRHINSQHTCSTESKNYHKNPEKKVLLSPLPLKNQPSCKFSTTVCSLFLQPSKREKGVSAQANAVLDSDYLDAMVEKMLRGKHGTRLEFLRKRSLPNLPEDKPGVREDVVKDWNHIHETVRDLGVPEIADVIGGQIFAGANGSTLCTTSLAYQLADNLEMFTDSEICHIIKVIKGWPREVIDSESLNKILSSLDGLAAKRCESWENTERLQLALIWASYSFRPSQVEFCRASLQLSAESLSSLSLPSLLQYLLLVSYRADDREIILESFENIEEVANILETNFHKLTETEVAVAYSALHHLSPGVTKGLGERIHRTYGFRL